PDGHLPAGAEDEHAARTALLDELRRGVDGDVARRADPDAVRIGDLRVRGREHAAVEGDAPALRVDADLRVAVLARRDDLGLGPEADVAVGLEVEGPRAGGRARVDEPVDGERARRRLEPDELGGRIRDGAAELDLRLLGHGDVPERA